MLLRLLRAHREAVAFGALVFAFAFALRLAFVLWIDVSPGTTASDDSWFYHHAARALADGKGFIFPGRGDPTAQWPPGYPAILSAIYLLPGPDVLMAKLVNVLVGSVTCALVYALARMVWGRTVGLTAGLLLAVFPSHVYYSAMLLTEVIYAALIVGIVLWFVARMRGGAPLDARFAVPFGLVIGVATMVRGEAVLLPLVFGAAVWAKERSWEPAARATGLIAIGLAVIVGIWTVRNAIEMGAPVPISTGSARMAQAHWDGANGGPDDERVRELNARYPDVAYPEREIKISQYSMRQGLKYMVTHPLKELSLVPRRLYYLYRHDHAAIELMERRGVPLERNTFERLRTAADAFYFAAIAWSTVGIRFWWQTERNAALVFIGMVVALSALVGILYAGIDRYHAVFIPFLSLMSAPALVFAVRGGKAERALTGVSSALPTG